MTASASWNNAPPLFQIAASQQGGTRGAQLWAVTQEYALITTYQETPGGAWSPWQSMGDNQPSAMQIAAAQQNNGCVQLWVTGVDRRLWTITQNSPGGDWGAWEGPDWNNSPMLAQLAASQQGGSRGAQLWATTIETSLQTTYQESPGGSWSEWLQPNWNNAPPVIAIAAAEQNNGEVATWIVDDKQQLWCATQTSPGGDWTPWSGPNWNNGPLLNQIAASQQGGSRGAQLWGSTQEYVLTTTYQETPGGAWSPWQSMGDNPPSALQIAAAQQNNGCVQLWVIDLDLILHSIQQLSPGGDWGSWTP